MQIGAKVGAYEVIAKLGEGGMGAVYRARDARLGRDVALKLLPDTFSHDSDRIARFDREAHVLASLNHPNVATIYGLEQLDTHQIIVMELVDGETLEARLSRGALPVEEVRRVGRRSRMRSTRPTSEASFTAISSRRMSSSGRMGR